MVQHERHSDRKAIASIQQAVHTMSFQPPVRSQRNIQANVGLVKRLSHTQSLNGHSSAVNALDWSSHGEILLSGGDDCRVKLWSLESSRAIHTFDSVRLTCNNCYTHDLHLIG